MIKKFAYFALFIFSLILLVSCTKTSGNEESQKVSQNAAFTSTVEPTKIPEADTGDAKNFKVLYQGFIPVDADKINDYAMTHDYIITKEEDWNTWNSKYTSSFPYYLQDMGMDWTKECLIVYAYNGAKDFWNVINSIENVSFANGTLDITFNEAEQPVYAFNSYDEEADSKTNIALYVIKIDKPDNITSYGKYLSYETYSQSDNQ